MVRRQAERMELIFFLCEREAEAKRKEPWSDLALITALKMFKRHEGCES
jgi:hypothetical protein